MSPRLGERHDEPGQHLPQEWTGSAWAPVCPADDIPMTARDARGWLCCGTCGVRSVDASRK